MDNGHKSELVWYGARWWTKEELEELLKEERMRDACDETPEDDGAHDPLDNGDEER